MSTARTTDAIVAPKHRHAERGQPEQVHVTGRFLKVLGIVPATIAEIQARCATVCRTFSPAAECSNAQLVYENVKPGAGGNVSLMLGPLELIDRSRP
jgi:hypothetical protein